MHLYGLLALMPLIAMAILGVALDYRLLVAALMLTVTVVPMAMFMLYIYYMLTPQARRNVLPKKLKISRGDHIAVSYRHPDDMPDDRRNPLPADETIPWSDITAIRRAPGMTIYYLRGNTLPLLLVPDEAFNNSHTPQQDA